ncbi:MAG: family 20 glycosylhydrolase [Micromonosporaceae bacterium]
MRRRIATALSTLCAVCAATFGVGAGVASAESSGPVTLPALRQWTAGGDAYTLRPGSRVVVSSRDAEALAATAGWFAEDLTGQTGIPVAAVTGEAPGPGDIQLSIGAVEGVAPAEGYRIVVGKSITIRAVTVTGVSHGTQSVLQWLRQGRTVAGGTATDWPAYPERGLLLDVGRQYMSLPWLRQRIRELAYLKLNYLHLHLSDWYGFRLQSSTHPEVVSPQHYTKAQLRELIGYAARYHVRVVPEIDMPGHMDPILAAHPELKLVDRNGTVSNSFIDLSKPAAYALMKDLITEFMPVFPIRTWHIGGDEYVTNYDDYPQLAAYAKTRYGPGATGRDAYYGFLNWAAGIVRAAGEQPRIWNDGLKPGGATLTIDSDIVVEHWSASGPGGFPWSGPAYNGQQLVDQGHLVSNMPFTPAYYTTGGPASLFNMPPSAMYDAWEPNTFVDGTRLTDATKARNLGSRVALWCDEPNTHTEAQLATVLRERLRVMAQQTWGSRKPPAYLAFIPVMQAVGDPPR